MTCARSEIVDPSEVGVYHCVSRCVRRAFLCGWDKLSGRSLEHRREWIRTRLAELAEIFAIDVIAYAILMNHLHSLLRIRPDLALAWTKEEVARRWRKLFPLRRNDGIPAEPTEEEIAAITADPAKVELYRKRLADLSWFNRCLNEQIARLANAEDKCTGRFWEGRFKCQRVYDLGAILACAAYIDLNPIRAGIATTPEASDHTSVQDRIHEHLGSSRPERCTGWARVRLLSIPELTGNTVSLEDYLALVDQTGRQVRHGKKHILPETAPILARLKLRSENWLQTVTGIGKRFRRIVAPGGLITAAAAKRSKSHFHGIGAARLAFST